jgi:hypothetical protein
MPEKIGGRQGIRTPGLIVADANDGEAGKISQGVANINSLGPH